MEITHKQWQAESLQMNQRIDTLIELERAKLELEREKLAFQKQRMQTTK